MSQSPNDLVRSIEETQSLAMAASLLALENLARRLSEVSVNAAREHDRVQEIASRVGNYLSDNPLAKALGLALPDDAAADVDTAFRVQMEACDLTARLASEEADRILGLADEVRSILPVSRSVATDPPASPETVEPAPVEPTTPPIVPAPEPNPAPSTLASEETVVVAANASVLDAPRTPLTRSLEEVITDPRWQQEEQDDWKEANNDHAPPDEDDDTSADEEDLDDDNEGTDLNKATVNELAQEVFGEPVSASDEARARVLERFPDARIVERGNGQRSGTKYIVYTGQGRQSRPVSTRRSSEAGAWIDAAGNLS